MRPSVRPLVGWSVTHLFYDSYGARDGLVLVYLRFCDIRTITSKSDFSFIIVTFIFLTSSSPVD